MTASAGRVSGHYAGAFTRLAAFVIDWFVIVTVFGLIAAGTQWVLAAFFGIDVEITRDEWLRWTLGLGGWAFLYMVVGLAVAGRTPGKAILGLRVVTRRGDPLGLGRAAARVIMLPLSFLIFGIGLLGIVLGRERRALHDVLAGTAVVYDWGDRPAEMPAPLTRWIERQGVAIGASPRESSEAGG